MGIHRPLHDGLLFVVPLDCAAGLAKAIAAGASGTKLGSEPDWYADFEKQYAARTQSKDTAPQDPSGFNTSMAGQ